MRAASFACCFKNTVPHELFSRGTCRMLVVRTHEVECTVALAGISWRLQSRMFEHGLPAGRRSSERAPDCTGDCPACCFVLCVLLGLHRI